MSQKLPGEYKAREKNSGIFFVNLSAFRSFRLLREMFIFMQDDLLSSGDQLRLGQAMGTPGHTPAEVAGNGPLSLLQPGSISCLSIHGGVRTT
jgi:hypothetical protein